MKNAMLWAIARTFVPLSLVAIGGANAILPGIHHQVVDRLGWMDSATFANLFAIAQAAPGPNALVVSLIGWHMAGLAGLLVASLAMFAPTSVMALAVGRLVKRMADVHLLQVIQAGLVPIAVGLMLASGIVITRAADRGWLTATITAATTWFVLRCNRNPLWALAGGALASIAAMWLGLAG